MQQLGTIINIICVNRSNRLAELTDASPKDVGLGLGLVLIMMPQFAG